MAAAVCNEGKVFVITDCGSTTTKAILIEKKDGVYRQTYRGEAPTTVEAPVEDVTVGVKQALSDLSRLSGRTLIDAQNNIIRPAKGDTGCDMYISTSSAGGGLQMVVLGLVKSISAASALKAALGAGAIVTDCIACDDEREQLEQVTRLRKLRPDIVLLAGGTDGGQETGVVEMAELLALAEPRPRFGDKYQLPVVFAGNQAARTEVEKVLEKAAVVVAEKNVRPSVDLERLSFARDRIHALFLDHVMQQAPGFGKLIALCDASVMPTPSAVGKMLRLLGREKKLNALCVDIGGATTDIFSMVDGRFNRTVSANLGMSYSAGFVLQESGIENIRRWLPSTTTGAIEDSDLLNQLMNKTVRPTTLPETRLELDVEQALAREALRLSLVQHIEFSGGLKGAVGDRNIDGGFSGEKNENIHIGQLDMIIGSGGVLSHAPEEWQTVAMLLDAFLPEGVTTIAKDSIFMMPHLGILSELDADAAMAVFFNDCIVPLVTAVTPVGKWRGGRTCLAFRFVPEEEGEATSGTLAWGEVSCVADSANRKGTLTVSPVRGVDVGAGRGRQLKITVSASRRGIVFDGRGRPLSAHDSSVWHSVSGGA